MTIDDLWDGLLLPLADVYDTGNPRLVADLGVMFPETIELLRECLAAKIAEGSLIPVEEMHLYRLTPTGYAKYKSRIDFLRAFSLPD
jgi:hypothetical protein